MIQITRIEKPAVLEENAETWLGAYHNALSAFQAGLPNPSESLKKNKNQAENRYNHPTVKDALILMFSGKCAFCESQIRHIDYGSIEHFKPKLKFPDLCFSWENFLLSCNVCNDAGHKGINFPEEDQNGPFVNPVDEDPNDFFNFEFDHNTGTANVIPTDMRGTVTEKIIGLNRPELVKYRSSIVRKMVLIAIKARDGDIDCYDEIHRCCLKESEYAAFARALVRHFGL